MTEATQPKVICLMGPTAAGKTDLAIEWLERYPCEIVSVDSALVYRGMDIGTAKPDAETLARAPHRLINIIDPSQAYSAADFYRDAQQEIEQILAKDKIPLLVGGTMLYFQALQKGLSPLPSADATIRADLEQQILEQGLAALYNELQKVDPVAADKIKATDKQRIQRALEVYRLTGQPLSVLQQVKPALLPYRFINTAVIPESRPLLHERIAQRFDQMLAQGFIEEVEELKSRPELHSNLPSMRAVGYRQVWQYLAGEIDKQTMRDKGIIATRQLAKRQLTWLRQWPDLQMAVDFSL